MTPTDYAIKAEFARIEGDEEKAALYAAKAKKAIQNEKERHSRLFKAIYGKRI